MSEAVQLSITGIRLLELSSCIWNSIVTFHCCCWYYLVIAYLNIAISFWHGLNYNYKEWETSAENTKITIFYYKMTPLEKQQKNFKHRNAIWGGGKAFIKQSCQTKLFTKRIVARVWWVTTTTTGERNSFWLKWM